MDWKECVKKRIIKDVKEDNNLLKSSRKIAKIKIESADILPDNLYIGKITLLYDALRESLECIALEKGYKIYNHECYNAFIKEILGMSKEGDLFDRLRRIRNGINYYGEMVLEENSKQIIADLKKLIKIFQ